MSENGINKKKWLYAFDAKGANGEDLKFYILNPSRTLRQEGEIEYAKQLGHFVKAGLLPKAAWNTILENLGGTISEEQASSYSKAKIKFFELSIEIARIENISSPTEEQVLQKKQAELELQEINKEIQSFELEQIYIFENTADAKARNATIQWWLTKIAYKNENEKFFQGANMGEMLDWYDGLDDDLENDKFLLKIGQRFNYLITLWYLNRLFKWEDFESIDSESFKEKTTDEASNVAPDNTLSI